MRRIQLGLTQTQLGEKVKMSENRISEIESGRNNITLKSLHKIFSVLNINFSKLLSFKHSFWVVKQKILIYSFYICLYKLHLHLYFCDYMRVCPKCCLSVELHL